MIVIKNNKFEEVLNSQVTFAPNYNANATVLNVCHLFGLLQSISLFSKLVKNIDPGAKQLGLESLPCKILHILLCLSLFICNFITFYENLLHTCNLYQTIWTLPIPYEHQILFSNYHQLSIFTSDYPKPSSKPSSYSTKGTSWDFILSLCILIKLFTPFFPETFWVFHIPMHHNIENMLKSCFLSLYKKI